MKHKFKVGDVVTVRYPAITSCGRSPDVWEMSLNKNGFVVRSLSNDGLFVDTKNYHKEKLFVYLDNNWYFHQSDLTKIKSAQRRIKSWSM